MAIKFSQFNLRTDHTSGMYLVGYDGNQNIHITVDNLFNDFISGTENTIAMFGTGGTVLADSILSQDAAASEVTIDGVLTVNDTGKFEADVEIEGRTDLFGSVNLGDESSDLITQNGTLYLNGPVKDTTDTLGVVDQILVSDATGELTFQDLLDTHVESAEVVKVPVKNVQGSALVKGDPVYISGSVGASGRLEVQLADSSNSAKMPAVGLLFQDLANNGEGYVVITGKLRNIASSPIDGVTPTEGDVVYVKPSGTSGAALTTTKPVYGNFIQNIGKVGRVSTNSDGTFVVSSILRSNDIPNLTPGKIWVGSTGNTIESTVVHIDEANTRVGINQTTPLFGLDVNSTLRVVGNINGGAGIEGESLTINTGPSAITGELDKDGSKITNLADPTAAQDAATKAYVDSQVTAQDLDFQGDSGTGSIDLDSQSFDIAGGTYLTTSAASQTLTVNHDATTRTDTTSTDSPAFGGTFEAVTSVTTNPTGHVTAIDVSTVTVPALPSLDNYQYWTISDGTNSENIESTNTVTFAAGTNVTTTYTPANNTLTINSTDQYTGTVTSVGLGTGTSGTDVNVSGSPITTSGSITLNIPVASSTNTGKLSSTDWSTFNNKQDAITNPVTGTGTATRVAFWNSSSSISSDADLYWDDTNNRLGVGTASPTTDLHVDGSALVTSNATVRGDLRIDKNPSSFPTAKLQFLRNGSTSPAMGEFIMSDNPGHAGMYMYARRTTSPYTQSYIELPTSVNYDFEINLLGHNVLTIDSYTKNVGLETTSPRTKLDINGPLAVVGGTFTSGTSGADSSSDSGIVLRRGKKIFSGIPSSGNEDFYLRNLIEQDTSNNINIGQTGTGLIGNVTLSTGSSGNVIFRTTGSESARINSSGNVGIGNTAPSAKLHVGSSADQATELKIEATNTAGSPATTTSLRMIGYESRGQGVFFEDTGNSGEEWFAGMNYASSWNKYSIGYDASGGQAEYVANALFTVVGGTGEVGIGTAAPNSKLQVDGAVQVADDTDTASASKVGALRYRTSGNNSYVDMCMQTGASTYAWVNIVQNSW